MEKRAAKSDKVVQISPQLQAPESILKVEEEKTQIRGLQCRMLV